MPVTKFQTATVHLREGGLSRAVREMSTDGTLWFQGALACTTHVILTPARCGCWEGQIQMRFLRLKGVKCGRAWKRSQNFLPTLNSELAFFKDNTGSRQI